MRVGTVVGTPKGSGIIVAVLANSMYIVNVNGTEFIFSSRELR